jgi:hypothetical protein
MMVNRLLNKARDNSFTTPPMKTISMPTIETISSITTTTTAAESTLLTLPSQKATIPRSTATAAQLRRVVDATKKREYNKAFKRATVMYSRERAKGKSGMSARSVTELIRIETKIELSARSIQQKVKEGQIGTSPLRRGPRGNIPELHYRNLCLAFESYIRINQINGTVRECGPKKVGPRIYKRLRALAATVVDISDTQYGRQIALKKRELEAVADKFSR